MRILRPARQTIVQCALLIALELLSDLTSWDRICSGYLIRRPNLDRRADESCASSGQLDKQLCNAHCSSRLNYCQPLLVLSNSLSWKASNSPLQTALTNSLSA